MAAPYNAEASIGTGTAYFATMLQKAGGDPILALAAYNMGPGVLDFFKDNGGYSVDNMKAFSTAQKKKLGVKKYGDPNYVENVLGYYSGGKAALLSSDKSIKYKYDVISESDKQKALEDRDKQVEDLKDKQYENDLKVVDTKIAQFENIINDRSRDMSLSETKQSRYSETSNAWRDEEITQNKLSQQKIDTYELMKKRVAALLKEKKIDKVQYDNVLKDTDQKIVEEKKTMEDRRTGIFNSRVDQLGKETESINRELTKSEALIANMDTSSVTYRKELQRQIKLKKQIVVANKEEMALIKERLKNGKLGSAEKEDLENRYAGLSMTNFNTNLDVKDDIGNFIDSQLEIYEGQRKKLNNSMDASKSRLSLLTEGTEEYRTEVGKQVAITERQIAVNNKELAYIDESLKRKDLDATMLKQLTERKSELNKTNLELLVSQRDLNQQMNNADKLIENYKKMIEKQRDLELEVLDKRKEAEDERHEKAIKNMEDEYNKFEEVIQAQLKNIDRQETTDDHNKELSKKLEERQKLQNQINTLSLDDSWEAKAKREQLQEQLGNQDEDIAKFRLDRERDLRKQNLNDQLEDKKNKLDREKKVEDDKQKKTLDDIEEEKKAKQQYYQDVLEDESKWYVMKQNLLSNDKTLVQQTLTEMTDGYAKFFLFLQNESALASSKMKENLQYSVGQDFRAVDDYSKDNQQAIKDDGAKKSAWEAYLSNKQKAKDLVKQMKDAAAQNKTGKPTQYYLGLQDRYNNLKSANDGLRSQYGFPDGSYASLRAMNIFSAETGGMTAAWGPEGKLAMLHEKELVLNKDDTSNLLKAVNVVKGFAANFSVGNIVDKIGSMIMPKKNESSDNSVSPLEINFNIDKVYGTLEEAKTFASHVVSEMKKKGIHRR
nr:transglycosylase SLT domain-containing protein [Saccharibacillus deserti]